MSLARKQVAILGLGLMGGSLALALRGKCAALLGIDPDHRVIQYALERRIVDRGAAHPAELLSQADLIVLAAPVRAILNILRSLPELHPNPAVVLDLGSTKVEIAAALAGLPERFEAVAGHPFCGKETSSIEHAEAGLYQSAPFVLVELPNSTPRACEVSVELVQAIGARPLWLDAETHDRWAAATSHLPYLLANALAAVTPPEAALLVGPGFRSTSRLAPSSQQMMVDILSTNRQNVLSSLGALKSRLEALERALADPDEAALKYLLDDGAEQYRKLID